MDHFELKLRRYANGILVCPLLNYLLEVDIDEVVLVLIVVAVGEEEVEVGEVVVEDAEKTFLYIVCKYMCMYTIMYVITYVCK